MRKATLRRIEGMSWHQVRDAIDRETRELAGGDNLLRITLKYAIISGVDGMDNTVHVLKQIFADIEASHEGKFREATQGNPESYFHDMPWPPGYVVLEHFWQYMVFTKPHPKLNYLMEKYLHSTTEESKK